MDGVTGFKTATTEELPDAVPQRDRHAERATTGSLTGQRKDGRCDAPQGE
jgi:hypothetical protein